MVDGGWLIEPAYDYEYDYDYVALLCSAICFLGRGGVVRVLKEYHTIQS